jgi:hypothetical protein
MDVVGVFILRNYLLFFLLPAWNLVGALDWWCHRRAGIKRYGIYEPMLHLTLLLLAGAPLLLGLFLDINGLVLLIILCFVAHEAVGYVDIAWATRSRGIRPVEQRVHDYLAAIPFAALSLVIVLHWQELILLFRQSLLALHQPLQLRAEPLPSTIVGVVLLLVVLCNVLPYVEEFARAVRYRMKTPVRAERPRL